MHPSVILAIVFGGVVLFLMVRIFQSPVKWALKVLQGSLGLVALGVWNHFFSQHGWAIGLNPVTGATIGVLGPPGFLLMVAIKMWVL